jgi:peptide/nickel transport system substrate-binding protein
MKKIKLAVPLLLLIVLAISMSLLSVSAQEPRSGGVLKAATDAEWTGLDPHVASTVSSFVIIGNVVEGLTYLNDSMELEPLLAESWELSEDQLTWTFTLRQGVTFSNGAEFNAESVVYSMNRILDPATGSGRVSAVGGADAVWQAVDTYTVSVTTPTVDVTLPTQLASAATGIIHPDSVTAEGTVVVPIGTGPFTIEDLDGTISVRLVKNPNYWQAGLPYLDAVEISVIQEGAAREAALLGGSVDWIRFVEPQSLPALQADSSIVVQVSPALAYHYIGMNLTREPFNDVRVRQAISYALDRQQICDAGAFGVCTPIQGPIDTGSPWYFDYAPYDQDLEKARQLLAEAGFPNGFEMELMPTATYQDTVRQAQVIQAQLAAIGITATINAPEWAEWLELEGNFQFDAYICSWNGLVDVDQYYYLQHRTGQVFNFTGYSNPEFDALVDQGRQVADFDARYAIYEQANKILVDDAPYIYFYNPSFTRAMTAKVEGYVIRPDDATFFARTWLAE